MARRRLKSMADARRYLSNLINRVEHGEVDPVVAGRLGFLTNILLRCIEASSLEDRNKISIKQKGERLEKSIGDSVKERGHFVTKTIPSRDKNTSYDEYIREVRHMINKNG